MPFILKRAARKKSRFYRNILDANETEQLRVAEKELKRMQVSGSNLEGTKPIRDENGTLISYQSPFNKTKSIDEPYQYVRLQMSQKSSNTENVLKFFGEELDFSSIYPEESFQDEGEDIEVLRERLKTEINKNKELNDGLVDSINNLNNKVADLNNTDRGTQLQKTGSILSIPIFGGVLKGGGKLARKISKWFGG